MQCEKTIGVPCFLTKDSSVSSLQLKLMLLNLFLGSKSVELTTFLFISLQIALLIIGSLNKPDSPRNPRFLA